MKNIVEKEEIAHNEHFSEFVTMFSNQSDYLNFVLIQPFRVFSKSSSVNLSYVKELSYQMFALYSPPLLWLHHVWILEMIFSTGDCHLL